MWGYMPGLPTSFTLHEACTSAWVYEPHVRQWNNAWVSRCPTTPQTKQVKLVYAGWTRVVATECFTAARSIKLVCLPGAVVIGRRSQGHDPWRSPGIHRNDQSRKAGSRTRQNGCSVGQDPANVTNPNQRNRVKLVSFGTPDGNGNDEPEQHLRVCVDGSPGTAETGAGCPGNRPGQPVDDTNIYPN